MEATKSKKVMAYYPGCSLHSTANDFAISIEKILDVLDVELVEIKDWCCCGASSAHKIHQKSATGLVKVNIDQAKKMGMDTIFAPCAACYNRLKVVADELNEDVKIVNLADLVLMNIDKVKNKQKYKLDLNFACYYGCLLNKPHAVFKDNCENPMVMEKILETLGMKSVEWPFKTECCGASFSLSSTDVVHKLSGEILSKAQKNGAEVIVTSCPLCHVNLDMRQLEIRKIKKDLSVTPVLYLSELIAMCVGVETKELKLNSHYVPIPKSFEERLILCHA